MSLIPCRSTEWRHFQKIDNAIQLGVKLSESEADMEQLNNNIQNINMNETESIRPPDIIKEEQNLDSSAVGDKEDVVDTSNNYDEADVDFILRDDICEADIASALVLLKKKHNLSISCITDIINLLKCLDVPQTPSSWYKIKRLLSESKPSFKEHYICSACNQRISKTEHCSNCSTLNRTRIQSFHSFSIREQLQLILLNNKNLDLCYENKNTIMSDILDGAFFHLVRTDIPGEVLTLTLNVDGVQPNRGSSTTIWPILLVINEIPPEKRFRLENMMLGGFWPGPAKPSRDQMKLLFRPLIDELIQLERGCQFNLSNGSTHMIKIFLIGACCDKPAQALLQCISEPTAAFGCGHCEVEGFVVRTSDGGNVRSFSISHDDIDDIERRSNERYDQLISILQTQKQLDDHFGRKKQSKGSSIGKRIVKGIVGECLFRELSYFDVGRSFMADSLHNIYIGAFKRMLGLWLNVEHKRESWSIAAKINELDKLFRCLRLPSTTTRIPRSLTDYKKFKANELRVLLLFGHVIFRKALQKRFYNHLLQLVVLMHLAEAREIHTVDQEIIYSLSRNFVLTFPKLYTDRHCVQVVHSVLHVPDTIKNFGPMPNYTTFQFENDLGLLVKSTKGSRNQAQEISSNLHILQKAVQYSLDSTMNDTFAAFLLSHLSEPDLSSKQKILKLRHKCKKEDDAVRRLFPTANIEFYNVLHIGDLRLTTRSYAHGKKSDDSNILFLSNGTETFGRIRAIFIVDGGEPILFVAYLSAATPMTCDIDHTTQYEFPGIQRAPKSPWSFVLVHTNDFIEKTAFFEIDSYSIHFFRFPNLRHSS